MTENMWGFKEDMGYRAGADLTGFDVEAIDGRIGKVDKHSEEVGAAYLVVDTGVWIFGRHVLLPAGTISSIDLGESTIYLSRTKDDIEHAPAFDKDKHLGDEEFHRQLTGYYGAPHS
ncbi:PRC-barrel domain-containing protein [Streptomyces sp. NPDC101227]|uniref:PRC-barrel domain-containing protein n=1 Tax=Streptomyces sp. NPDC101227 TaxID=3366136 RepID=UPI00381C922A